MSVKTSSRVWEHSFGPDSRRILLLALADRCDDDGLGWPGLKDLMRKTHKSKRRVQALLKESVEAGQLFILHPHAQGRGSKTYFFVTCGLDREAIREILEKHPHLRLPPLAANQHAEAIITRREEQERVISASPFSKPRKRRKGDIGITLSESKRVMHDDTLFDAEVSTERVISGVQKGDIQSEKGDIHGTERVISTARNSPELFDLKAEAASNVMSIRHEERHVGTSVDPSCARADETDETASEENFSPPEKFYWTLDDSDPGGFDKLVVALEYERLTGLQLIRADREQIEIAAAAFEFSSAAVCSLMQKIRDRTGSPVRSFRYFQVSLSELHDRCARAARSTMGVVAGSSLAQKRSLILRAVRREIAAWNSTQGGKR